MMTIRELIERLEELADTLGDDVEVRLMSQPNWPFEYTITGVTDSEEIRRAERQDDQWDEDDPDEFDPEGDSDQIVYIVEGQQLGYGTSAAWNVCY